MKKLTLILVLAILLERRHRRHVGTCSGSDMAITIHLRAGILTRHLGSGLIRRGSITMVIGFYRVCCIIFSDLNMAGPRITRILPPILSDPITGMGRCGIRGISATLITGKISSDSIPIGPDTEKVSIMIRDSMKCTIVARGLGGRKASVVPPLKNTSARETRTGSRPGSPASGTKTGTGAATAAMATAPTAAVQQQQIQQQNRRTSQSNSSYSNKSNRHHAAATSNSSTNNSNINDSSTNSSSNNSTQQQQKQQQPQQQHQQHQNNSSLSKRSKCLRCQRSLRRYARLLHQPGPLPFPGGGPVFLAAAPD